jgi:hypothetical protein
MCWNACALEYVTHSSHKHIHSCLLTHTTLLFAQVQLTLHRNLASRLRSATVLLFCTQVGVQAFSSLHPNFCRPTTNMMRPVHMPFAKSLQLCAARRYDVNNNNDGNANEDIRRKLYSTFDEMQEKGVHFLKLNPDQIEQMIR